MFSLTGENSTNSDYIENVKRKGKMIIHSIVVVNLLFVLAGFVTIILLDEFEFLFFITLIWTIFVLSMLYFGRRWAKWFFIITTIFYIYSQVGTLYNVAYELNREYSYPITDEIRAQVPEQVTDEWLAKYLSPYGEHAPDEILEKVLSQIPDDIVMPDPVSKGLVTYVFVFSILEIIVSITSIFILLFNYAANEFLFWQRSNINHRTNY